MGNTVQITEAQRRELATLVNMFRSDAAMQKGLEDYTRMMHEPNQARRNHAIDEQSYEYQSNEKLRTFDEKTTNLLGSILNTPYEKKQLKDAPIPGDEMTYREELVNAKLDDVVFTHGKSFDAYKEAVKNNGITEDPIQWQGTEKYDKTFAAYRRMETVLNIAEAALDTRVLKRPEGDTNRKIELTEEASANWNHLEELYETDRAGVLQGKLAQTDQQKKAFEESHDGINHTDNHTILNDSELQDYTMEDPSGRRSLTHLQEKLDNSKRFGFSNSRKYEDVRANLDKVLEAMDKRSRDETAGAIGSESQLELEEAREKLLTSCQKYMEGKGQKRSTGEGQKRLEWISEVSNLVMDGQKADMEKEFSKCKEKRRVKEHGAEAPHREADLSFKEELNAHHAPAGRKPSEAGSQKEKTFQMNHGK